MNPTKQFGTTSVDDFHLVSNRAWSLWESPLLPADSLPVGMLIGGSGETVLILNKRDGHGAYECRWSEDTQAFVWFGPWDGAEDQYVREQRWRRLTLANYIARYGGPLDDVGPDAGC